MKPEPFVHVYPEISDQQVLSILGNVGIKLSGSTRICTLATGMLNVVKRIKVGDGLTVILRIRHFRHPEYGQEFAAERLVYPLIDRTSIRVPRLIEVDIEGDYCGFPWALFECIRGPTLDVGLNDGLSIRERRCTLERLAISLAELHVKPMGYYGTLTTRFCQDGDLLLFWASLIKKEQARIRELDIMWADRFDKLVQIWAVQLAGLPRSLSQARLVHGDLHGRNIIIESSRNVALIDWEACRVRFCSI